MTTRDKIAQAATIMVGDAVKMVIKKATTRVDAPPKRKHVQTLQYYIKNQRANFPHLIDCLSARFRKTNWLIAMKSLLTTHILILNAENDAFLSYIASRVGIFELSGYVDRSSLYAVDMSINVTSYSKFLLSKCEAFRYIGRDVACKEVEKFAIVEPERLFKEMELIHTMIKNILENTISFRNVSSILQSVHMYLAKELLRVFSAFNKRMVFLLENINELEAKDATKLIEFHRILVDINDPIQEVINQAASNGMGELMGIKISKPSESLVKSIEEYVVDIVRERGSRALKSKWLPNFDPEQPKTTAANTSVAIKPINALSLDFDPTPHVDLLEKKFDPSSSTALDMIDFNTDSQKPKSPSFDNFGDSISTAYEIVNRQVVGNPATTNPPIPSLEDFFTDNKKVHSVDYSQSSCAQPQNAQLSYTQTSYVQPIYAQPSYSQSSYTQTPYVQKSFSQTPYTQPPRAQLSSNQNSINKPINTIPEEDLTIDKLIQKNLSFDQPQNLKPLKWETPSISDINTGYSPIKPPSGSRLTENQFSFDDNKRRNSNNNNPFL